MTQGWYLLLSTLVLMGIQVGALISMSEVMFPGMLEIETFLWLNLVTYLVLAVASGMTFLCSCVFSEGKYAIGFGAAIPVVSFMLKMFGEVGGKVEVLKYGSIYMLLEPVRVMTDSQFRLYAIVGLSVGILVLYGLGIWVFNRKSLNI